MRLRHVFTWMIVLPLLAAAPAATPSAPAGIDWHSDPQRAFARARELDRPVFLYLEAVWCHWCHVMQRETFTDAAVQSLLAQGFVALRIDHDAHPQLANRYRSYGWPALVFLDADGRDLAKRAGYRAPDAFAALLRAIAADPTPEQATAAAPAAAPSALLDTSSRNHLRRRHDEMADLADGGLRTPQKFVDRDSVEYALTHADDAQERRKAESTLAAARALIDPVWGGIYQYSTGGRWDRPHYEKIMRSQAGVLRSYALAWARLRRNDDLRSAHAIRDYLLNFLRAPSGAFHNSQDADLVPGEKSADYFALGDAARRARGVPRIDPALYADASAQAAEGLAALDEYSADAAARAAALAAGRWLLDQRRDEHGRYRHADGDDDQRYLSDTLAAGRAFFALYRISADPAWLDHALTAATALQAFRAQPAGFAGALNPVGAITPQPDLAENISVARFANLLHRYAGRAEDRAAAEHAMRYLAAPARVRAVSTEPGILLADEELATAPLHLTVVGAHDDPAAQALYRAALQAHGHYKRIDWWDRSQPPLPNLDIPFPKLPYAAGYVCNDQRCSLPSRTAPAYVDAIRELRAAPA